MPPIIEAARQARRRGVDVVLLDDSDPAVVRPEDLELVITRISAVLTDAQDGRLVARLLPPGREGVATLLVDGSTGSRNDVIGATQGSTA